MKVLLINDGTRIPNWGIKSCSQNLINLLSNIGCSVDTIPYDIVHSEYMLDHIHFFSKRWHIRSSFLTVLPRTLVIPAIADEFEAVVNLWNKGHGGSYSHRIIEQMLQCDIVLFNAEGSTYRKNFGARAGIFMLLYANKVIGKKCLFANGSVTISSVDNVFSGFFTLMAQSGIAIAVREPASHESLKTIGVDSVIIPDTAFLNLSTNLTEQPALSIDKPFFAVSKSMLPMYHSYQLPKQDPFFSLISTMSQELNADPLLLSIDREDRFIQSYNEYLLSPIIIKKQHLLTESFAENAIGQSSLLLSGRYHHLIFAIKNNVPIIPLDTTSHKIKGLCKLVRYSDSYVYDPCSLVQCSDKILNHSSRLFSSRPNYSISAVSQFPDMIRQNYANILFK
jgi:hypothetical protein